MIQNGVIENPDRDNQDLTMWRNVIVYPQSGKAKHTSLLFICLPAWINSENQTFRKSFSKSLSKSSLFRKNS